MAKNFEVESKNHKLMAKIYHAMLENLNQKHISILLEDYDIHYRLPENSISRLCKQELIGLSVADCLIEIETYSYKLDLLNILVNKGLHITSQNAKGLTILHRAMQNYFKLRTDNWFLHSKLHDETIDLILTAHIKTNNTTNPRDEFGISHFHIACMANHVEAVNFFLNNGINPNETVSSDSPRYPGYTPLHFAARYCSLEVADVLLKNHADLHITDTKAMLPLHILVKLCIESINDLNTSIYNRAKEFGTVQKMIDLFLKKENENLEVNYLDHLGFSLLHAACAMIDMSMIEFYLKKNYNINAAVNMNSSVWPGYTPLHFAAHFKTNAFQLLFDNGGDIEIKDAKGVPPFDIIVTRFGIEYLHAILMTHSTWKDIVLSDEKTKLVDLVWSLRDVRDLETFLDHTSMDVNVIVPIESPLWPGYSPLHLAILFTETLEIEITEADGRIPNRVLMYLDKIKALIRRGAYFNSGEVDGLSLGSQWNRQYVLIINKSCPEIMNIIGYTRLFEQNNDINPGKYANFKELLFALEYNTEDEHQILIDALKRDVDRQRQIEQDYGLTMLHVACWELDIDWVKDLLNSANINAQTPFDLPRWAGCTPLHILMKKSALTSENDDRIDVILQLLLEKGADTRLKNAKQSTSLHATEACEYMVKNYQPRTYANSPYTGLLLKRLEDFNVDVTNVHGISYFYIACIRNDVRVIEQFLNRGVNANTPVHLFSDKYAGCTPLHLAMIPGPFVDDSSRKRTIDLLISHGADVFAEDSRGNTLLHAAAKSNQPREGILEKFICLGLQIDAKNIFGDRPLESLLLSNHFTTAELSVFTNRDCQLHTFNPINQKGYLTAIFRVPSINSRWDEHSVTEEKFLKVLTKIGKIHKLDDLGRTIIHNFVSNEDCYVPVSFIDYLVDHGCDIDHRDNLGRTALHLASEFRNGNVKELLHAGADINIVDNNGESAFACSLKSYKKLKPYFDDYIDTRIESREWHDNKHLFYHVIQEFIDHVKMMRYCGLYVSDHIEHTQKEALKEDFSKFEYLYIIDSDEEKNISLFKLIEKTKGIKFGSISLYDFLLESRATIACRSASPEEYDAISDFLLNSKIEMHNELEKVFYIAKRVYRKITKSLQIIIN